TVPNIVRWTKQDEFLLTTGYPLPRQPGEFGRLIEQLVAKGLAGLGVKLDEYLAEVPADAVELADRAAFPIVVIPPTSPLDDVLSQTFETIVNRQAAALARRQLIHDAFLRVALTGGGLARLSGELAEILPGADVVICDPAGYPLAATTRSLAVLAAEQHFPSNALHDLVTGTAGNMDQALERAVRFGWDLRRPLTVLVARHTDTEHGGTERRGTEHGGTERRG